MLDRLGPPCHPRRDPGPRPAASPPGRGPKVAGVAGGLARHLDIDPIILRVASWCSSSSAAPGSSLYGAVLAAAPRGRRPARPLGLDERNRGIALVVRRRARRAARPRRLPRPGRFPWPLARDRVRRLVVLVVLDRDRQAGPTAPPVAPRPTRAPARTLPAAPGAVARDPTYRPSRATRAGAARSSSGSPSRWPPSASGCSASSTWPAPRSPTPPTRPWSSASAA